MCSRAILFIAHASESEPNIDNRLVTRWPRLKRRVVLADETIFLVSAEAPISAALATHFSAKLVKFS